MQYCLNGTDLGGWRDDGIDSCLYGTLGAVVPFTYSFILRVFIIISSIRKRRRYRLEKENQQDVENSLLANVSEEDKTEFSQKSWYYFMQMVLGSMLVLESAVRGVLEDMVTGQRDITGQQVLTSVLGGLTWMLYLSLESSSSSVPNNSAVKNDNASKWLLIGFLCLVVLRELLAFMSWFSPWYWWSMGSPATKTEFGLWVIRLSSCLLLLSLKLLSSVLCSPRQHMVVNTEEKKEYLKKKKARTKSTWTNVFRKLRMMLPYVWPKGSVHKQGLVGVCVLLLGLGRVVNLLVPIVSKDIIDNLSIHVEDKVKFETGDDLKSTTPSRTFFGVGYPDDTMSASPSQTSLQERHTAVTVSGFGVDALTMNTERELMEIFPFFCWKKIVFYCFLMFLKGGGAGNSGMLNNARSFCWVPVQQYTTKHIQLNLFHHLQSLSLRWHLHRQTGEVLKVMDRGTNSINMLLSHLLFHIVPILADITIAIVFFVSSFNYLFGLIVFFCMATYISLSVVMTEWRTKYRRDMNRLDNEKNAKAVDALLNFETVKYYGAADFEKNQYKEAITKYQKAEFVNAVAFNLLNLTQNVVILCGLMTGTLVCGWGVVHSLKGMQLTVGDYVLFGTYINQLYGPIQWLGNYYRMIQTAFVDMENMFDLFKETQEVKDAVGAEPIEITKGEIEFRNVSFHYDSRKPILKNVSFCVPPGQTYALVGHSGSGKSTVVKLLFRFYDVKEGCILIDGNDISQVQQESLRKIIGVVPQDIVMFNNNIKYNIRYGKVTSTEEEVEKAAEAADIHDRILNFPNKYDTVVGERGLKLSGGEKQRVAIARTLLKSPSVVLLDEATSALDTKTERNIQNSLFRVCEGRTTIVVAHRLSTIIHAHQILVMEEGEIVERGSHQELLDLQGIYASMWQQQLTSMETTLNEETEE